MDNMSVSKFKDLETVAKQWVQRMLGRTLTDDEEVAVMAFPPHDAPAQHQREQTARKMDRILDKSSANLADVSEKRFDEAIDEAMDTERRRNS